jgi:uncharacterized protein (TIGR00297 family)
VQKAIIGLVLGGGLGGAAYWRRLLTLDGGVAAAVVGATVFARGGLAGTAALMTFFVTSSALSRLPRQRGSGQQDKGSRRDALQVLANGGPATVCIAISRPMGFLAALMAAGADTWATEVGMLSRRPPRLITTGRVAPPGTSGAVSPVGTLATGLGAGLIGAVAALGQRDGTRRVGRLEAVPLGLVSGLSGAFADSFLGATVQARYRCPTCGVLTERTRHRCGAMTELVGGWRWLDNDAVNFASSLVGGAVGWLWGVRAWGRGAVERESVRA